MGLMDRVVSTGIEKVLGIFLEGIGEISGLSIDSKERIIRFTVLLKGEKEPFNAVISGYQIIKRDNSTLVKIHSLKASREWAEAAFDRYFKDREVEIPAKYASMISAVL